LIVKQNNIFDAAMVRQAHHERLDKSISAHPELVEGLKRKQIPTKLAIAESV